MAIVGVLLLLLGVGAAVRRARPDAVDPWWLGASAALVFANDFLLTRGYGLIPDLMPGMRWNWEGKLLALGLTLVVAARIGWRTTGITLRQDRAGFPSALMVSLVYCLLFLALAIAMPGSGASREELAFQATLPGLEEEAFYRGVLLYTLDRAFPVRRFFLGVTWGLGAVLSSALFGPAHALDFGGGRFGFDIGLFAMTAIPSLLAVWVRLRSGSIALPVFMHNFGNLIGNLV